MTENPAREVREKLGLSRHDVAMMAGTSTVALYNVERGSLTKIPASIEAVYAGLGVDIEELHRRYSNWRMAEGARMFIEARSAQGIGVR